MSLPTAQDVRDYLEGYSIDTSIISSDWINNRQIKQVLNFIKRVTGITLNGTTQLTEFYSGTGKKRLILNHKPIISLDAIVYTNSSDSDISLSSIDVNNAEGILIAKSNFEEGSYNSIFPKGTDNIQITYTIGYDDGDTPEDLEEAILYLTASHVLRHIAYRTGGGALSVQGHSRNYKGGSKFDGLRKEIMREAMQIINAYSPGVVGS